jgi:hypothetical protein
MNIQIAKNFQKFIKLKALTALINDSNCKNEVFPDIQQKIIGTQIHTKKLAVRCIYILLLCYDHTKRVCGTLIENWEFIGCIISLITFK